MGGESRSRLGHRGTPSPVERAAAKDRASLQQVPSGCQGPLEGNQVERASEPGRQIASRAMVRGKSARPSNSTRSNQKQPEPESPGQLRFSSFHACPQNPRNRFPKPGVGSSILPGGADVYPAVPRPGALPSVRSPGCAPGGQPFGAKAGPPPSRGARSSSARHETWRSCPPSGRHSHSCAATGAGG